MSISNAFEQRPAGRPTVHLTIHDGRYFELADLEDEAPSLWVSDLPRSSPWPMTTIRIFAEKANLRDLRDLLNRADLGDRDATGAPVDDLVAAVRDIMKTPVDGGPFIEKVLRLQPLLEALDEASR